jgi:hypothetical protein
MKACPFCAEEIQDAAIVCKHCGRDIVPATAVPTAASTKPKKRVGRGIGLVLLVFLAFGIIVAVIGSPKPVPALSDEARQAVDEAFAKKAYIQPTHLEVDHGFVIADFEVSDDFLIPKRRFGEDRLLVIREALLPYGYKDYRVNVNGPSPGAGLTRRYGSARLLEGNSLEWVTP